MSKKKDSLKPWLSRPAVNRSVTLPLTRPLTQRLSNLNEFHPNELDPYLLFDAQSSMLGTLEASTLDLDPSNPSTLDVITATRSGTTATYTDSSGLIQVASADTVRVDYTQGEQLTPTVYQRVNYTDFSSGWTANDVSKQSGNGYLSEPSAIITVDSTSSAKYYYFLNAGTYNYDTVYTGSFFIRRVSGNPDVYIDNYRSTSSESTSISLTDDWQKIEFTFTSPSDYWTRFGIVFGANNSSVGDQVEISQPQVEEGTTASSFVANTTGSPKFTGISATYGPRVPMILVEPSATNLWGWSEGTLNDYQTNAVLYGGEYLSTDATSRNGLNSWLYFEPSSDTVVGFRMPVSVNSGSTMILSFYVIMDDGSKPRVGTSSTGSDTDFAILLQGSSSAGAYGGVEHIDGDLYRVWAYRVFTGTSNGQYIYRYATHSGKGFKISGVMLEESSVPTSYIPTSGSTVTRAADNLEITGSDFTDFYNQSEGTFYVEAASRKVNVFPRVFKINGVLGSEYFEVALNSTTVRCRYDNATNQVDLYSGNVSDNTFNKIAVSYRVNDFLLSVDGGASLPDTNASLFSATSMRIGNSGSSTRLNGHIKRLIYWPTHSDSL